MQPELLEVLHGRSNPEIDPHLHIWGWEISAYLFVGGLVAGLMVLLAALELFRGRDASEATPSAPAEQPDRPARLELAPFWGIALLSAGMLFLFLDLAYPGHVYRFYTTFEPTSPMSWGAWILVVVYPALTLLGLGALGAERRAWLLAWRPVRALRLASLLAWALRLADRHRRAILWTTLSLGIALGAYTGLLLGTMAARPTWNSGLLGPLFLTSGISTGAALLLLMRPGATDSHRLVRWDSVAIGVELGLLVMLMLGFATGGTASKAAAATFMGGDFTASFVALVVVGGLLVPLALNLIEVRRRVAGTLFAPVLVLVGGLALRVIFVSAGQVLDFASVAAR